MKAIYSRRDFIQKSSTASIGLSIGLNTISAKSYSQILGANDRVRFAVIGLHGRGREHIKSIASCPNATVSHVCDVDQRELEKGAALAQEKTDNQPVKEKDFRLLLESKDIDAITIATPEHWHAPMAIMGVQAGKHVYVEKPCSHNPAEGEMLIRAQEKYQKLIQLGNQQRSSKFTREAIQKIHDGVIGKVYFAKAFYTNNRSAIGIGKEMPVPKYLDWDLWQGPAPRLPYKDIYHPYNWHWFWHWGTGETLNNGTHEVDISLWGLDVQFPNFISAAGGRYHYQDDWEFYDTLITSFEYDDKMITWEGKSCNKMKYFGRGRGTTFHGTEGALLIDRNGYQIYDLSGEKIFTYEKQKKDVSIGVGGGGPMTDAHFLNFILAIQSGEKLNSPIDEGNIAVTMLLLSNIAWKFDRKLKLEKATGHIQNDSEAMQLWQREYEKGWEPNV